MISLFCYINERYEKYKLAKLLKKLENPINIDSTSLRSKFTRSKEKKITINLSITYDIETHQSQVSELKVLYPEQPQH